MYAAFVVGLALLLLGVAVRRREGVVLPEDVAEFVGFRLVLVGGVLAVASLTVLVGLLPAVAIRIATFLALLLAISTAVELRLR